MNDDPKIRYRRQFKLPSPGQAILIFAVLLAVFALVWGLQQLGLWPDSWTLDPGDGIP